MILNSNIDGPRACSRNELQDVIKLADEEMRKNTGQTILTDYPHVYAEENLKNIRIIKVNSELASVVPFVSHRLRVGCCEFSIGIISPTVTSPNHRKKGYALKCLKSCLEQMDQDNISLSILWTLIPTFPFYEKADYQAVGNQAVTYKCSREDADAFSAVDSIEIAEYTPESEDFLDQIKGIYEENESRVIRTRKRFKQLLCLPKIKTYLALKNNRVLSYLVASKAINKPGILESGGDEKGLEVLFHRILLTLEADCEIKIYVCLENTDMGNLLAKKIPDKAFPEDIGHMMVRLNNPSSFLSDIALYLNTINKSNDLKFSFEVSETNEVIGFFLSKNDLVLDSVKKPESVVLSRRELASIVFGSHPERMVETPIMLKTIFPFYLSINVLDHS